MKKKLHHKFQSKISSLNHPFIVGLFFIFSLLFIAAPILLNNNSLTITTISDDIAQMVISSNMKIYFIAATVCFFFGSILGIQTFKNHHHNLKF